MRSQLFSLFILLTLLFSCKQKTPQSIEAEYLSEYINKLSLKNETEWLVVLPGLGCHGCIQEGEAFMRDHAKNKNVYFVLTSIESIKVLQYKTGVDIKKMPNVYLDKSNTYQLPTNNRIYPCIIKLENGEMVKYEFQKPENGNAFTNLATQMSSRS